MSDSPLTIRATEFDYFRDCWKYALANGLIVHGEWGDARIPCGIAFTERNQWAANQVFGRRV